MKTKIDKDELINFFISTHPSAQQPMELLSGRNIDEYPEIATWAEGKINALRNYCEDVINEVGLTKFAEWIDFPIKQSSKPSVQLRLFNL